MLAKCTGTSLTSLLDSNSRANFTESVHLDEVALTVGDTYVVYGVITRSGFPWFLVCEASDDEYPKPHFGGFFELLDERVPPEWSVSLSQSGSFRGLSVLPRPWAEEVVAVPISLKRVGRRRKTCRKRLPTARPLSCRNLVNRRLSQNPW